MRRYEIMTDARDPVVSSEPERHEWIVLIDTGIIFCERCECSLDAIYHFGWECRP